MKFALTSPKTSDKNFLKHIFMIITRFRKEMIFSHEIRAERAISGRNILDLQPEICEKFGRSHRPSSLRLPKPRLKSKAIDMLSIEIYGDATAWPLLSLLQGFDLSELFLPHRDGQRWPWPVQPEKSIRFCALCAKEQIISHFVSWWMRDLNLPLVAVCPVHRTSLNCVPVDHVLKMAGYLPHELLDCSCAISGRVDDESVQIANSVIALCNLSATLDSVQIKEWIQNEKRNVDMTALDALRTNIAASTVCASITGLSSTEDNGLLKRNSPEDGLVTLILRHIPYHSYLYKPLDVALAKPLIGMRAMDIVIEDILDLSKFKLLKNGRLERLLTTVKYLTGYFNGWENANVIAIHILILHFLDRDITCKWLSTMPEQQKRCLSLTDQQIEVGMYVLQRGVQLYRAGESRQLSRYPDIRHLMHCTEVIPTWGISFAHACVLNVKVFLDEVCIGDMRPKRGN
jgi:hypothetical protein